MKCPIDAAKAVLNESADRKMADLEVRMESVVSVRLGAYQAKPGSNTAWNLARAHEWLEIIRAYRPHIPRCPNCCMGMGERLTEIVERLEAGQNVGLFNL